MDGLIETLDEHFSHSTDVETKKWVCIALSQIVLGNPDIQEKLGATGIEAIISVMANIEDVEIRATAAEALNNMADNEVNCAIIASLGGVKILLSGAQSDPEKVWRPSLPVCLAACCVVAPAAFRRNGATTILMINGTPDLPPLA